MANSFTVTAPTLLKALVTPVQVGPALNAPAWPPPTAVNQYEAIWDTGATASVITEKIISECGLKPISVAKVHGANGEYLTEVYLISLLLPNRVGFNVLRVTKGRLPGDCDMLVGMDVISQGDFAVTNYGQKTCFSFRCPSLERIDFTGTVLEPPAPPGP